MRYSKRKQRRKLIAKNKNKKVGKDALIILSTTCIFTMSVVSMGVTKVEELLFSDSNEKSVVRKADNDVATVRGIVDEEDTVLLNEYTQLVNKQNSLTDNYAPISMDIPNIVYLKGATNKYMSEEVIPYIEDMFEDAKKEDIHLRGVSGYRSYDYQKNLYSNKVKTSGVAYANKYIAKEGESEHQLGLALDLVSRDYSALDSGFATTDAYEWLEANMHKYGFILRYPEGKESITGYNFEPWHIRFVGVGVAEVIFENDLTLEEYLNKDL